MCQRKGGSRARFPLEATVVSLRGRVPRIRQILWQRISWDEALATTASRLFDLSQNHGPESVVFSCASPSTRPCRIRLSGCSDCAGRLKPEPFRLPWSYVVGAGHLASIYTYGTSVPGVLAGSEHAGCILYWGYNPAIARLVHATQTVAALNRGARLIVVDPRRAGLARRADHWLRVRPGTDGALALAMTHVLIEHGWFDREFVCRWTNAPCSFVLTMGDSFENRI